jgi:RecB family endonuclease NucS
MARLPSERYVIQQIDGIVILFEDMSEREIVRFDPSDANAAARAQDVIAHSELGEEDRCFAHFWSGYFYCAAQGT